MATSDLDSKRIVEAIDKAFEAQIDRLFANLCLQLSMNGGKTAIAAYARGFAIARRARDAAIKAAA